MMLLQIVGITSNQMVKKTAGGKISSVCVSVVLAEIYFIEFIEITTE